MLLRRCADEIARLRSRVASLEPKAEAYDCIAQVLSMVPQRYHPPTEDFVRALERRIFDMNQVKAADDGRSAQ